MKALRMRGPGGPEVLEIAELPLPDPAGDELLVKVGAAGLNGADLVQRRGAYPPPPGAPPDLLGLEFAGRVAQAGPRATRFSFGDRICGIVPAAAQAEYVLTREAHALPVPGAVTDVEAGGLPEAYLTAYDALVNLAHMRGGETVLVHAIGSGVGCAAVQIAKQHGCTVIGTSRTPEKLERAMALGLDEGIDAARGPFAPSVVEASGGRGADIILDFVGAPYMAQNIEAAAPRAHIVLVSTLGGPKAELPIGVVMRKRLTLVGTALRSRSYEEKAALTAAFERDVVPFFADRRIAVPVDRTFDLEHAKDAHAYLEAGRAFGKVVFLL